MDRKKHWEKVYKLKNDKEVGWYQENPATSLTLVEKYAKNMNTPIIDVGGGNSFLTKILFDNGFTDLTVLDISANAIVRSQDRFDTLKDSIKWSTTDILDYWSEDKFQIWHDRAVFHFLLDDDEIKSYADIAEASIKHQGYLIIGAFSLTGPISCSNLPISQYSEEAFCNVFNPAFQLVECFNDVHTTPSGNKQDFIWAVFKRS